MTPAARGGSTLRPTDDSDAAARTRPPARRPAIFGAASGCEQLPDWRSHDDATSNRALAHWADRRRNDRLPVRRWGAAGNVRCADRRGCGLLVPGRGVGPFDGCPDSRFVSQAEFLCRRGRRTEPFLSTTASRGRHRKALTQTGAVSRPSRAHLLPSVPRWTKTTALSPTTAPLGRDRSRSIRAGSALRLCPSSRATSCVAVDRGGFAVVYNGRSWAGLRYVDTGGHGLDTVSCPSRICASLLMRRATRSPTTARHGRSR